MRKFVGWGLVKMDADPIIQGPAMTTTSGTQL